jgi:hypothetical protein
MKMREALVVSCSLRRMTDSTAQGSASVASRCAKNLARLRSLLVSSRCTSPYCRAKQSANCSWYLLGGGGAEGEGGWGGRRW